MVMSSAFHSYLFSEGDLVECICKGNLSPEIYLISNIYVVVPLAGAHATWMVHEIYSLSEFLQWLVL